MSKNKHPFKMDLQRFASNIIDRSGAEALMPEDVSREIIQGVPENSVIMRMGTKAQNMSRKQRRVPVLSSLPMAYFVDGDIGRKQISKMLWENKFFEAEELAVIIPIPEAVLDDTDYDLWGEIKPRILEAIGVAFDQAVLFDVNAPQTWPKGLLAQCTTAGNVVTLGTGADLFEDLLGEDGIISQIEEDGFMANGHIAAMSMRGKLRSVRDTQNNPIFLTSMQAPGSYVLDGAPIEFPKNGAMIAEEALMFTGDFSQLVYALRQDVTYKLLTEAVIQDNTGAIIYNLAQQDMVALRVVIRLAWQIPNPINRVNQNAATRLPFAALKPAAGTP